MKDDTFKAMDEKALAAKITEMRVDLIKIRSELASKSASQKVGQIHKLKKSIARALTRQHTLQRAQLAKQMKKTSTEVAE